MTVTTREQRNRSVLTSIAAAREQATQASSGSVPNGDGDVAQPATFIGRQMTMSGQSLVTQIEELKKERHAGRVILALDPKKIRATEFKNRLTRSLLGDDPKFHELRESLRAHGQETPIRVRPVKNALPFEFEIVSGHRRHAACVELDAEIENGFPILAIIDAAAEETRDLVLKMYRENEERYDLSAYEKGLMFSRWLEAGVYASQRELAAAIGMGEASAAKYLAIAGLPKEVLAAFGDERLIPMSWGPALSQALKTDTKAVFLAAESLALRKPPASPDVVLKTLVGAVARKSAPRGASREESVRIGGRIPLKVASGRNRILLKLQHLDEAAQKQLREELKDWAEAWLKKRLDGA